MADSFRMVIPGSDEAGVLEAAFVGMMRNVADATALVRFAAVGAGAWERPAKLKIDKSKRSSTSAGASPSTRCARPKSTAS